MYHVIEVDKFILHPPAARGKREAPISGVPSCQNHQNNKFAQPQTRQWKEAAADTRKIVIMKYEWFWVSVPL